MKRSLAAILVVLLAVTACGAEQTPSASPSTAASGGETPAQPEGTLTIADEALGFQTPGVSTSFTKDIDYMRFMFDWLVGSTADGVPSTESGAAESWESSPDHMTWTFKLREGITFHNGDKLTAEDVKFSIGLAISEESKAAYKDRISRALGSVDNIEIPDPYTLVMNLVQPDVFFFEAFSDAVGVEGIIQPKAYTESVGIENFATDPVGSGPYKMVENIVGDSLTLEVAFDDHWRYGTPKFERVVFRAIPEESTRIAALENGEVDLITVSRERIADMGDKGFSTFTQCCFITAVELNQQYGSDGESSVFEDVRVREAMNLAINREEVCEFVFVSSCRPGVVYPYPSISLGADPTLEPYPYDPDRARALLQEAGYDGTPFTLYSVPVSGIPEWRQLGEALKASFEAIGMKVELVVTEYQAIRPDLIAFAANNTSEPWAVPIRPLSALLGVTRLLWHSEGFLSKAHQPELDRLIEEAETAPSVEAATEAMRELYRYMYANYLTVTLTELESTFAGQDWITVWEPGQRVFSKDYTALIEQ